MGRCLAMAVLLCAVSACEPAWSVQGQVRAEGTDRRPVRGATAALRCPGMQDLSSTTDHDGLFELGGRGPGPGLECSVAIAAPAYAPASISLAQACEDAREDPPGGCEVAMVDVVLTRR
jgi:hypothetical protein